MMGITSGKRWLHVLVVIGLLGIAPLTTLLAPPTRVAATDFTVTTCDEGHFRAAVSNATATGSGRVLFACDGTITLTKGRVFCYF